MKILGIYQHYQIMPALAEHQLRVAGVAKIIFQSFALPVDADNVVAACLLHDMGNIIKFDLTATERLIPGGLGQHNLAYWQAVQQQFIEKYGSSEHVAALAIARELGVSQRVVELIDCVGFEQGMANATSPDFGKKLCAYSDMRVAPLGVVSLEQRLSDLRARYESKHRLMGGDEQQRLRFEQSLRQIERQIFAQCSIKPQEISESIISMHKAELEQFDISFAESSLGAEA